MTGPDFASRLMGCLRGGAIGDAFGYEIEFDSLERIRARFGPQGMQAPVRHRSRLVVSDDTQMTLFIAEGLVRARSAGCLHDDAATLEHLHFSRHAFERMFQRGIDPDAVAQLVSGGEVIADYTATNLFQVL